MDSDLFARLVPDGLWQIAAPLLPSFGHRPQGGGTAPRDERIVFTAVVYVLTSGCAWRQLPKAFGVSPATAHRRFVLWSEVELWRRLHDAIPEQRGTYGELAWTSTIVQAAAARAHTTHAALRRPAQPPAAPQREGGADRDAGSPPARFPE
ncbi:transposase [Streptomyces noursei]|uniref:transposase n=1 Tax=Streptomyces noursei TaxID=1971 RepID=UPI00332DBE3A